ncbi:MAG: excinuclease ABC subunit UvrC [Bacteroidales bacterium]|nr:excinuclease ABC subunit UvrC [Bacteroidales bacterium]
MKERESLREQALLLPGLPGIYIFVDSGENIIYVGKAKNLKKRVLSYFSNMVEGKTRVMVARINEIRHIVVGSESDALLLENNFIKEYQPRYNVLMKDDKSFPWICVKNENFPRVFITRNIVADGSRYYGPYTSAFMARTLLQLVRKLYKLRTCGYNLAPEKIRESKYRVCLEFHLGNCLAPCVGKQKEEEYNLAVAQVEEILKGNIHNVAHHLKGVMKSLADNLLFEAAQAVKEKIAVLENYQSKSAIVGPAVRDVDVLAYSEEDEKVFIHYMRVVRGAVVQAYSVEFRRRIEESLEDVIALAISVMRERYRSDAREIIVPLRPDIQDDRIKYTLPVRGDKLRLLELAERNAVHYRLSRQKQRLNRREEDRGVEILKKVQNDLRLPEIPVHIECFDNSNIQGDNPVAACVVFRNGKPSRGEYRHYKIKMVTGPDDYASMEEVVFRRYRRLLDEDEKLPQLVIVDGGKGQLSSALKSFDRLGIRGRVSLVGIAKRLEQIYFPDDPVPLYIDKNSVSLKIIQNARNEAHRFGISFHRNQRSLSMKRSMLDQIKGIGPVTREKLLKEFGSLEKIAAAPPEKIADLIGRSRSEKLLKQLRKFGGT